MTDRMLLAFPATTNVLHASIILNASLAIVPNSELGILSIRPVFAKMHTTMMEVDRSVCLATIPVLLVQVEVAANA